MGTKLGSARTAPLSSSSSSSSSAASESQTSSGTSTASTASCSVSRSWMVNGAVGARSEALPSWRRSTALRLSGSAKPRGTKPTKAMRSTKASSVSREPSRTSAM
ncbi:MAG: hypothetical protein WKG00_39515 [Polyangiaceae bacterium]